MVIILKTLIKWWIKLIIVVGIVGLTLFLLAEFNLNHIKCKYASNFFSNLNLISKNIFFLTPVLIFCIIVFLVISGKFVFRVEKFSLGGFNILFDSPTDLFKRQVQNFLDTKRTLFYIDHDHDNYSETFDSYYETYKFLRDEIRILGRVKVETDEKSRSEKKKLYKLANQMIQQLNKFLTTHQNDFRRWYKYQEIIDKESFYTKPIGKLQANYYRLDELQSGFTEINRYFVNDVAPIFSINIKKWDDPDA